MPLFITPWIFWFMLLVVFLAAEALTLGLTSIWFAIGALAAMLSALIGAPLQAQAALFIAGSVISIAALRPVATKYLRLGRERTNADRVIGKTSVVLEDIDNMSDTGMIKINGQEWSARSETGESIKGGTTVIVIRIEGVRLYVKTYAPAEAAAGAD